MDLIGKQFEYLVTNGAGSVTKKATLKKIWKSGEMTLYSFEENKDSINSAICRQVIEEVEDVKETVPTVELPQSNT